MRDVQKNQCTHDLAVAKIRSWSEAEKWFK